MTAICLYLPEIDIKCNILNIEILPFLKEKGFIKNTKDNMPETLHNQLKKFNKFLNSLLYICDNIREMNIENDILFIKIINFFTEGKVIRLYHYNKIWEYKYKNNEIIYNQIYNDKSEKNINIDIKDNSIPDIINIFNNNNNNINIYNGINIPNFNQIKCFSETCEFLANNYNYNICNTKKLNDKK